MRLAKMAELRSGLLYAAIFGSLMVHGVACNDDDAADHDAEHGEQGDHEGHEHDVSTPIGDMTGAPCPDESALTYDNFGQNFFATYCLSCHSEHVTGAARHMAPTDHNFDSLADIALLSPHIDQYAGSGPKATNDRMPPADSAGRKPTMDDREKLSEWLACGAP